MTLALHNPLRLNTFFRRSLLVSLIAHALLFSLLVGFSSRRPKQREILITAAGEGGGGGAIPVGVVSTGDIPSLAAPDLLGGKGPQMMHQVFPQGRGQEEITLEPTPRSPRSQPTEKPVTRAPLPYSTTVSGTSPPSTAGPSASGVRGGVGIGFGEGFGSRGIPGGSDYGRRLQQALIGYYRYAPTSSLGSRFVIVRVRFDRTGRILSIVNGRLDPLAFIVPSGNPVIDARVEAALLELNRNPIPFPGDFLPGIREAIAEIYFQY